jgi:hypothetical protein
MAVPISNVARRVVFTASGTGPYAFTFEILAETDIAVYNNTTLLTLTTDYTVTINTDGTGSITLVSTPTAGTITIVGARTIERTSDFTTGGDLFATTLNDELDSLTIFIQQNAEDVSRSITAPVTDPTTIDMELPGKDDRKGKVLAFNATSGNPEAGPEIADVGSLADITADIALLADIQDGTIATNAITTVSANNSNVTTVAGISGNVTTVAGISSDVTTVAADGTDIGVVSTNIANVNSVAGNATNINNVAGNASNINTVAGSISNVNTVSSNITDVNSFANIYRIGATDPTTSLDEGDLFYNSTDNVLRFYDGSAWNTISSDTDVKTKVSSNDTTAGFLNGKLVASTNISFTENNDGGNETLGIAVNPGTTLVQKSSDTGSAYIPAGSTGDRDGSPAAGYLRFNTTTSQAEIYDGSAWASVGGGAAGSSGEAIFFENEQVMNNSYTITTGHNASCTGPLSIASGATLTIPTNSVVVIL